jgi:hypothetical protein
LRVAQPVRCRNAAAFSRGLRLGACDLEARYHEMPDDAGRTRSAAIAACARLRRRPK